MVNPPILEKKHILFLFPGPIYKPNLFNFADRFVMLSNEFDGTILTMGSDKEFKTCKIGDFDFNALINPPSGLKGRMKMAYFIIKEAMRSHRLKPYDVIVCYDPYFTGILGTLLKLCLKTKLVIEINSENYFGINNTFNKSGFRIKSKEWLFKLLSNISLLSTNGIKVLTPNDKEKLPLRFRKKQLFSFYDYVPTHRFSDAHDKSDDYILFVGYPYELKGVEVLIKAFQIILPKYPKFRLVLIGHEIEKQARKMFTNLPPQIEFQPGLHYDALYPYLQNCYCFVLPSRTEGVSRAVIEAMACGKPVIVTEVGGMPSLIDEEKNGFLIHTDNVDQLAEKLDILLSDQALTKNMGKHSRELVVNKFSSQLYCDSFVDMINHVILGSNI